MSNPHKGTIEKLQKEAEEATKETDRIIAKIRDPLRLSRYTEKRKELQFKRGIIESQLKYYKDKVADLSKQRAELLVQMQDLDSAFDQGDSLP